MEDGDTKHFTSKSHNFLVEGDFKCCKVIRNQGMFVFLRLFKNAIRYLFKKHGNILITFNYE